MGITDTSFSAGWFTSWKARFNISSKVISGEAAAVDLGVVDNWQTTTLPEILKQYPPSHIYNCDESALFYKLLPNKSSVMKGDTCHGCKRPKDRLTFMACTNMDGSDKVELLVVGRVWKPRCLKNVKNIPVDYHANNKAWITSNLFTQWSKKLDRRFKSLPGHLSPPQTTVNCFKKNKVCAQDDSQNDPKDDIPPSQLAVDEDDIPLASLFQQASQYMEVEGTLDDYLSVDQNLIAVTEEIEEDIFEDVMSKHIGPQDIQEDEEDEDISPQPQPPSCETILSHLEDIQLFLETHPDMSEKSQKNKSQVHEQ
ncbi:tigger transposable element-derived protein 4-like [Penaeus monodon]|uniref:tigger transposable element-derived protein 4-like n=1 Tax=Penaeus monodon TaxID=6687 RepID=UPI0018A737D0|nr:tigger transposable element-derived protein 4-like [Penaeus monodon]